MVAGDTKDAGNKQIKPIMSQKQSDMVQTSLRLPKTLLKQLKLLALERSASTSVNEIILEALGVYLESQMDSNVHVEQASSGKGDFMEIPKECKKWVAELVYILTEQNDYASGAIKSNLHAFSRLTKLDGGKNAPPPDDEPVEDHVKRAIDAAERAVEDVQKHISDTDRLRRSRIKSA